MVETTTLYCRTGTVGSLSDIYALYNYRGECWSWYEPKPESLIEAKLEAPLSPLLKTGNPEISADVLFSELMLFYPGAGITVIPDGSEYKYFQWSETKQEGQGFEEIQGCQKNNKEKAILRNAQTLKKQFNIPSEEETDQTAPDLYIQQYYHNGQLIAWTVTE